MAIEVLFFGVLTDIVKTNKLNISDIGNLNSLKEKLFAEYPEMKKLKFQIAVNKKIATDNIDFKEGDEIALLPPFAGG